ncbi:MAG: hypothetical protein HQM08_19280 [Candidatus Riflebacteria bacterium]|nr:hypothetical protein [Candidatus Riflebacteria bacterium]
MKTISLIKFILFAGFLLLYAIQHPLVWPVISDWQAFFRAFLFGMEGCIFCFFLILFIEKIGQGLNWGLKLGIPPSLELHLGFFWILLSSIFLLLIGKLSFAFCCITFTPFLLSFFTQISVVGNTTSLFDSLKRSTIFEISIPCLGIIVLIVSTFAASSLAPSVAYDDQVYQMKAIEGFTSTESLWFDSNQQNVFRPLAHAAFIAFLQKTFGEKSARLANVLFFLLLCLVMARLGSTNSAIIALVALISNPEWAFLSNSFYAEPFLCLLFIFAIDFAEKLSLFYLNEIPPKAVFLCGLLCGALPGAKYSGIFLAVIPLILLGRKNLSKSLFAGFALGFFFLSFPFYLRNWIFVGNPFFPHLLGINREIFSTFTEKLFFEVGPGENLLPFSYNDFLDKFGFGRDFLSLISAPFNVSIFCQFHNENFPLSFFDGQIGIIALLVPFFLMMNKKIDSIGNKKRLFICLVLWIFWIKGTHQIRLLMPVVALSAYYLGKTDFSELFQKGMFFYLALLCLLPWTLILGVEKIEKNCKVVSGKISEEQFLEEHLQPFTTFKWMEKNLPPNSKPLLLLEERSFHLKLPHFWTDLIPQTFINFLFRAQSAKNTKEILQRLNVTHILMPVFGWNIYKTAIVQAEYNQTFEELFTKLMKPVFHNKDYILFEWQGN